MVLFCVSGSAKPLQKEPTEHDLCALHPIWEARYHVNIVVCSPGVQHVLGRDSGVLSGLTVHLSLAERTETWGLDIQPVSVRH